MCRFKSDLFNEWYHDGSDGVAVTYSTLLWAEDILRQHGQGPSSGRVSGTKTDGVGTEVQDTWNDFSPTSTAYVLANL